MDVKKLPIAESKNQVKWQIAGRMRGAER